MPFNNILEENITAIIRMQPFANINQAYTTAVMPPGYAAQSTRYDIRMPGMQDNTNPAMLVIDSASRNHTDYPNPNKYTIKLSPVYKEVTAVELVTADIPNSGYIIESYHNQLHFQETIEQVSNDTYITATISPGNRTIDNIATTLTAAMNSVTVSGATYSVTVDTITNKITIEQTSAGTSDLFNLKFAGVNLPAQPSYHRLNGVYTGNYKTEYIESSIGPILGFDREDLVGETSYTGSFSYNLKVDKYISLFVNRNHGISNFGRVDSANDNVKGAFSVIPLDSTVNNFQFAKDFSTCDNDKYVVYFSEPIGELNEIDIEFRDAMGNLFNFNGHDHMLIFRITSQTRRNQFAEKH